MGKKRIQHFHPWPVGSGESGWDRGHGRAGIYQEIIQASIFFHWNKHIMVIQKNTVGSFWKPMESISIIIPKAAILWVSWYGKIQFFPGFSELFWNKVRQHILYTVTVSRWPFFSNIQRFAMGFIHQVSFSSLEWSAGRKFGKFWGCAILCAWLEIINLDISKRSCWRIWNLWKLLTGWRR